MQYDSDDVNRDSSTLSLRIDFLRHEHNWGRVTHEQISNKYQTTLEPNHLVSDENHLCVTN